MSTMRRPYTVMGHLLHDCPLDYLEREAEAGRWLKENAFEGDFDKLDAVEREIRLRRASS